MKHKIKPSSTSCSKDCFTADKSAVVAKSDAMSSSLLPTGLVRRYPFDFCSKRRHQAPA